MATQPPSPDALPPIPEDRWGLPDVPFRGEPVSARHFRVLLHAARTMKTVGKLSELEPVFSCGEFVTEINHLGNPIQRAAKRKSFRRWLDEHPRLAELLEDAINIRRAEVLASLESQALKIALSPDGDVTIDYAKDGKTIKRVRKDMRNASYMTLQLLKSLDERFADKRKLEVAGGVVHEHQHKHAHLAIGGANTGGYRVDLQSVREALTEDEARMMLGFLERIEDARQRRELEQRRERQQPPLPPAWAGATWRQHA